MTKVEQDRRVSLQQQHGRLGDDLLGIEAPFLFQTWKEGLIHGQDIVESSVVAKWRCIVRRERREQADRDFPAHGFLI